MKTNTTTNTTTNTNKVIVLTKKGYGTVTLTQGTYSDGAKYYTATTNNVTYSINGPMALNTIYKQHLQSGWTVKAQPEQKVAAPKKTVVKKTREESLTEKYGDKDSRREYKKAEAAFHRFYMIKVNAKSFKDHKEYLRVVAEKTANALKVWEAQGRPAYNC